ncbi:hypothetical protein PAPYR_6624 [Paratrimastix pyriformis]|uniref:Uncharacterized protein n=1 Tax=Paratrimastix pyriformis TaxID=342808 RepID=A0ABQ8UHC2_9EUKA|nr:hypothetical protein PAPYR_6624 [Paratrimastix pyriformis]
MATLKRSTERGLPKTRSENSDPLPRFEPANSHCHVCGSDSGSTGLTQIASPLVLRLSPRLERLTLAVLDQSDPVDLRIEGPGLRTFKLAELDREAVGDRPAQLALTLHHCPALASLCLEFDSLASITLGDVDDGRAHHPHASLRRLCIGDRSCSMPDEHLLAFLAQHGAGLSRLFIRRSVSEAAWPRLVTALGQQLPQLTHLFLGSYPTHLSLSCPRLRMLSIWANGPCGSLQSLVLDCPRLEELMAPFNETLETFELVGSASACAPPLWFIGKVGRAWEDRLEERFPQASISNSCNRFSYGA